MEMMEGFAPTQIFYISNVHLPPSPELSDTFSSLKYLNHFEGKIHAWKYLKEETGKKIHFQCLRSVKIFLHVDSDKYSHSSIKVWIFDLIVCLFQIRAFCKLLVTPKVVVELRTDYRN